MTLLSVPDIFYYVSNSESDQSPAWSFNTAVNALFSGQISGTVEEEQGLNA